MRKSGRNRGRNRAGAQGGKVLMSSPDASYPSVASYCEEPFPQAANRIS